MVAGRFRTTCPSVEEMHVLGNEMVEWVADKKNNCLHLTQWWRIHKCITSPVWECMMQAKEFTQYYEQAMSIIGIQYLDKNSRVRDGISQRWQRTYFKDLKKDEDQDLDDAAKRSSATEKSHDEAALAAAIKFMDMLKEQQQIIASESKPSPDTKAIDSHNE